MSRATWVTYLPPLRKSSTFLVRIGWETLGDQWGPISHKSTVQWDVGYQKFPVCVQERVLNQGKGELKKRMLEHPGKSNGHSSIQFLLWEFY